MPVLVPAALLLVAAALDYEVAQAEAGRTAAVRGTRIGSSETRRFYSKKVGYLANVYQIKVLLTYLCS